MKESSTDILSVSQIEAEFDSLVTCEGICGGKAMSWYAATELVKSQIAWLEYVPEHELGSSEAQRVILHAKRLYVTLRGLNHKYMD